MKGINAWLRINGTSHAFMREMGCKCARCSQKNFQAQTSISLFLNMQDKPEELVHYLFDCGSHVVDSLIEYGVRKVDGIFLSHSHFDHYGGVDRLVLSQQRHSQGNDIPSIWGSKGTLDNGPRGLFRSLPVDYREIEFFKPVFLANECFDIKIVPVPVYHGESLSEATIWVLELCYKKDRKSIKLVFAWDLLHLIPRYSVEDSSGKYVGTVVQEDYFIDEHVKVFSNVDKLFLSGNTLTPQPYTGHMSVETALKFLVPQIKPKELYIMHYSGHEDSFGPLDDTELQKWLKDREQAASSFFAGQQGQEIILF